MTGRSKKIIGAIIIVLLLSAIIGILVRPTKKQIPQDTQAITVRVLQPIEQDIPITIHATGYLVAAKNTVITPRAPGYIQRIAVHEGAVVTRGQVLFQMNDRQQKEACSAAQANFMLSKLQYTRDQQFLKKGFITQDAYYGAKAALKKNQAALATARIDLSNRTLRAPFSGTIGAIATSVGNYINPGAPLTTLVDNAHLRAVYALPVTVLNQLRLNQSAVIRGATQKNTITARVSYIAAHINQSTQTIAVHAKINNAAQLFKSGEYVTVIQNLGVQKNVLLLPQSAVSASINGYFIFSVVNNKAVRTPVTMGHHIGANVIILSGVHKTTQVIIAGENEVKNNQRVRVQAQASS